MNKLDKTERRVLIVTGVLIGVFLFSILYAKDQYKSDLPECISYDQRFTEPGINKINDSTYQVFAVAQMWQFQPAEISIPQGAEVDFYLSSKDVVHGFNIYGKNVNMMAVYGTINKETVRFSEPGTFYIVCHEYCGIGHQNMQAKVIVTENDGF